MRSIPVCAALVAMALCACRPQASASDAAPVAAPHASAPAASPQPGDVRPAPSPDPANADDHGRVNAAIDAVLGDHAKYEQAIDALRKAVAAHDVPAVAALIAYPFTATIDGKPVRISGAKSFIDGYDRILTPPIVDVITGQKYGDLFVNDKGVMFGNGEVWINGVCQDKACKHPDVRVVTIQPAK